MNMDAIGRKIRRARKSRGITQSVLARRARISEAALARLETNRRTIIGLRAIPRISQMLGLEVVAR